MNVPAETRSRTTATLSRELTTIATVCRGTGFAITATLGPLFHLFDPRSFHATGRQPMSVGGNRSGYSCGFMRHGQAEVIGGIVVADSFDHASHQFLIVGQLSPLHVAPNQVAQH